MPDWFAAIVGEPFAPILWVVFVAFCVSALAVVVLSALKRTRVGSGGMMIGKKAAGPRLGVVESIAIGDRRRLVLVRRDESEHLLVIGGPTDLVVERNAVANMTFQEKNSAAETGERAGSGDQISEKRKPRA